MHANGGLFKFDRIMIRHASALSAVEFSCAKVDAKSKVVRTPSKLRGRWRKNREIDRSLRLESPDETHGFAKRPRVESAYGSGCNSRQVHSTASVRSSTTRPLPFASRKASVVLRPSRKAGFQILRLRTGRC